MKQKFLFFIAFLIIAAAGIFAFLGDKIYPFFQSGVTFKEAAADCDLHTNSCKVVFENGKSIELSLSKPLKAAEQFTLNVRASDFDENELKASIYGVSMNMGVFDYTLAKGDDGVYSGVGMLPACMHGNMEWKINIVSERENIGASFILELL
jgi:hypothetical protein